MSLGLAAVGLCAHGGGWDAAATAVSPFSCAGPHADPAEPISVAGAGDPLCGVAAQSLEKCSCTLSPATSPSPVRSSGCLCCLFPVWHRLVTADLSVPLL